MKNLSKLTTIFVMLLQFAGCESYFEPGHRVVFPVVPEAWSVVLGQPHWRIQWLDSGGHIRKKDILPGKGLVVDLPVTWTNPVTAWPYWPEHNIYPGLFKPAGGFFPFEAKDGRLHLSWKAGPDTVFYWELALANSSEEAKISANFDWLRFRELFTTDTLSEAVCKDPWLVNWQSVAERTIASSFDRRRLVPETAVFVTIPVGAGPWYGTSPFCEPLVFAKGVTPVFPVLPGVNVWVSAEGILRVSGTSWILTEIRRQEWQ